MKKTHNTRFLINDNWTKKKYLTEIETKEANCIIHLRLNMINVKYNHKSSEIDTNCESDDTTEQWFECPILRRLT